MLTEINGPKPNWYNPPEGHSPECNGACCHEGHMKSAAFYENAENPDFECCIQEKEKMIREKDWCLDHGDAYMDNKKCLECLYEEKLFWSSRKAVGQ